MNRTELECSLSMTAINKSAVALSKKLQIAILNVKDDFKQTGALNGHKTLLGIC